MQVVLVIFIFAIGACIGSFLNVVIYRLPRGESIVFPGSHCPACGRGIRWYDNVPLLSWLLLKARCRDCKARISPRYILIELLTALLFVGLYAALYVLDLRSDTGRFEHTWPTFIGYCVLLAGLLAASAVDIELFIVPLPVLWVCAVVGIAAAAYNPSPLMPKATAVTAAVSVAATLGLVISALLLRLGLLRPSFLGVEEPDAKSGSVAITKASGVDPRKEILRELLFLAPALLLGLAAFLLVKFAPPVRQWLNHLLDFKTAVGPHLASGLGALLGMLVGIAWLWGTRIFGTLLFGKEAMGMGDVHIMAAIGAVAGWKVVTLTFFAAPVFGLIYALYLLAFKGKRELPYGPWLAFAAMFVIVFYDAIWSVLIPG